MPCPQAECQHIRSTLWPDHCVQGTPGCEIIPEIHTDKLDKILDKGTNKRVESYSAFGPPFRNPLVSMTELDPILKRAEITHVFCVGLSYNVCVFYTAIDAVEDGYKTFVIKEATASRQTADGLAATQKALEESGVRVIDMFSVELNLAKSATVSSE